MEVEFIPMADGACFQFEAIAFKGAPWKVAAFPSFFALIVHPDLGPILFDTGYTQRFFAETRKFPFRLYPWILPVRLTPGKSVLEQVVARGFSADSVKHVIVSHFHADHIGGLRDFPSAVFHCSHAAAKSIEGLAGWSALRKCLMPGLLPEDYATRLRFVEEAGPVSLTLGPFKQGRDIFGDSSVIAVPLPGHATGQIGVLLRSGGRDIFLVADACFRSASYKTNLQPGLLTGLLHDSRTYGSTLEKLRELHRVRPEVRIIPSHCNEAV